MVHGEDEIRYLRAYESATLRKPQIVADNVLAGIFLADTTHRAALAALLLQEAVEAARRLGAVVEALGDRSVPVARRLQRPLPGVAAWDALAERAGMTEEAGDLLRALGLGEAARESAEELIAFGGLSWFSAAIRASESGPAAVTVEAGTPAMLHYRGFDAEGAEAAVAFALDDDRVIALGDATGDFVMWAREFLGAYIDARGG